MTKKKKQTFGHVVKSVLVSLFLGANVAALLLLWLCCGSTFVSPEIIPRLSLIQLFFPVILIMNFAFVIFWLVFKIKWIWVPLVGMACCCTFIYNYYPIHFTDPKPQGEVLRVLSFNTRFWGAGDDSVKINDTTNVLVEYIEHFESDIICLQESSLSGMAKHLEDSMKVAGYECYNHGSQVIFSKFHILESDTLGLPTRTNGGVWAKLQYHTDTLLLVNFHFESNHLTQTLKEKYVDALDSYEGDSIQRRLWPLLKKISAAAPYRAAQVDSIAKMVKNWLPRPVIVCGDFNDTPVSYTLTQLTRNLTSAYTHSGHGLGFTFQERGFPVRIDHILYSDDIWESFSTQILDTVKFSDHLPIYTELGVKGPKR